MADKEYENPPLKGDMARKRFYMSSMASVYCDTLWLSFAKVTPFSNKIFSGVHQRSRFPADCPVGPLDIMESAGAKQRAALKEWIRSETEHGGLLRCEQPAPLAIPLHVYNRENDSITKVAFGAIDSEKPLLLSMGSCSCPTFMGSLREFSRLQVRYADRLNFMLINIREAHPKNGWNYPNNPQPDEETTTLEERKEKLKIMAAALKNKNIALATDGMENEVALWFQASPVRLAIIHKGRIDTLGQRGPVGYSIDFMEKWCSRYRMNQITAKLEGRTQQNY